MIELSSIVSLVVYEPRMFFHLIRFSLLSAVLCKLQCTSFTHLYFSAQDVKTTMGWGTQNPRIQFSHSSGGQKVPGKGPAGPPVSSGSCLSAWGESKGARALTLSFFLTMLPAVSFSCPAVEPAPSAVCPHLWTSRAASGALLI